MIELANKGIKVVTIAIFFMLKKAKERMGILRDTLNQGMRPKANFQR